MGKFVIKRPVTIVIITKPEDPGKAVYLRSKSEQQIIAELLKQEEIERLYARQSVEVGDYDPRAAIIHELWKGADSYIESRRGGVWLKVGKRFTELIVGLIALFVYLTIFVDPASFGPLGVCGNTPRSWFEVFSFIALNPMAWISYFPFIVMSWFIGWVLFALIGNLRSSGK